MPSLPLWLAPASSRNQYVTTFTGAFTTCDAVTVFTPLPTAFYASTAEAIVRWTSSELAAPFLTGIAPVHSARCPCVALPDCSNRASPLPNRNRRKRLRSSGRPVFPSNRSLLGSRVGRQASRRIAPAPCLPSPPIRSPCGSRCAFAFRPCGLPRMCGGGLCPVRFHGPDRHYCRPLPLWSGELKSRIASRLPSPLTATASLIVTLQATPLNAVTVWPFRPAFALLFPAWLAFAALTWFPKL